MLGNYKVFPVKLPIDIFEEFYQCFPEKGERQRLVRKFIVAAIEKYKKQDDVIEEIIENMR
jgi:hypothetical protein